jgi:hypothetical protein
MDSPGEVQAKGGGHSMSQHQIDIADMQCWVFRMAQTRWNLDAPECAQIFQQYGVFAFIETCYDALHLSSYQCALDDVEEMLRNQGVSLC